VANGILAAWRDERERLETEIAATNTNGNDELEFDPEAIIAELDHLQEHVTSDNVLLAKAAFQRVFKTVTLFWKQVSPRRRELVEAKIEAHYPFA